MGILSKQTKGQMEPLHQISPWVEQSKQTTALKIPQISMLVVNLNKK